MINVPAIVIVVGRQGSMVLPMGGVSEDEFVKFEYIDGKTAKVFYRPTQRPQEEGDKPVFMVFDVELNNAAIDAFSGWSTNASGRGES